VADRACGPKQPHCEREEEEEEEGSRHRGREYNDVVTSAAVARAPASLVLLSPHTLPPPSPQPLFPSSYTSTV
jgi:hypothetical protein